MIKFFKLFHSPKHFVFNYKPRFYDEKQRKREERFKKIREEYEKEKGLNTNSNEQVGYRPNISFRDSRWERKQKERNTSKIRLLIMIILIFLFYLLFFTNISSVLSKFFK